MTAIHHLTEAPHHEAADALFEDDVDSVGFVMNATRLWAHQPTLNQALFDLIVDCYAAAGLSTRQRALVVAGTAAARGDSYCALAWGSRLAGAATPEIAGSVLSGGDAGLDDGERALLAWVRAVVDDPNDIPAERVDALRAEGFDDAQIVALTLLVGLRWAFSSVNDALGARPDRELVESVPAAVAAAVTFGRPPMP